MSRKKPSRSMISRLKMECMEVLTTVLPLSLQILTRLLRLAEEKVVNPRARKEKEKEKSFHLHLNLAKENVGSGKRKDIAIARTVSSARKEVAKQQFKAQSIER